MENTENKQDCCSSEKKHKSCLCRPQMIFNIVASILIIVLLILQFYNPFSSTLSGDAPRIAYINSDSIDTQYVMVKVLEKEMKVVNDSIDGILMSKGEDLQNRINTFQQKAQSGQLSAADAKVQEETLLKEQEQYMALRDELDGVRQKRYAQINNRILDSLESVIKRFPDEFPFDYVMGYKRGAGILYASDKFDITNKVIDKMNKEFEGK